MVWIYIIQTTETHYEIKKKVKFGKFLKEEKNMLPVRCYTCNKILGHLEKALMEERADKVDDDIDLSAFFTRYRIERYCCRRILLTSYSGDEYTFELPKTVECRTESKEIVRTYLAR